MTHVSRSDWAETLVDQAGELVGFVADVGGVDMEPELVTQIGERIAGLAYERGALRVLVAELRRFLAEHAAGLNVALGLVRLSTTEDRAEILNAGLPPIACGLPGGRTSLYSSRNGPIGLVVEPTTVDLIALPYNATFLIASDGLSGGSLRPEPILELTNCLQLAGEGARLCGLSSLQLAHRVASCVSPVEQDDASLAALGAFVDASHHYSPA